MNHISTLPLIVIIFPCLIKLSLSGHGGQRGWGGGGGGGGHGGWNRPNQWNFPSNGWNQFGHGNGNGWQFQRPQQYNYGYDQGLGWGWPASGFLNPSNILGPYLQPKTTQSTTTAIPETTKTPTEPPPIIVIETGHGHNHNQQNGKEHDILVDEAGPISLSSDANQRQEPSSLDLNNANLKLKLKDISDLLDLRALLG